MNTSSVSVLLYDILFIALIGTGSSISAISQDTWMQISHLASVALDPARRSVFQTASGTPTTPPLVVHPISFAVSPWINMN